MARGGLPGGPCGSSREPWGNSGVACAGLHRNCRRWGSGPAARVSDRPGSWRATPLWPEGPAGLTRSLAVTGNPRLGTRDATRGFGLVTSFLSTACRLVTATCDAMVAHLKTCPHLVVNSCIPVELLYTGLALSLFCSCSLSLSHSPKLQGTPDFRDHGLGFQGLGLLQALGLDRACASCTSLLPSAAGKRRPLMGRHRCI